MQAIALLAAALPRMAWGGVVWCGKMVDSGMASGAALASQVIALSAAALSRVVHPGGTLLHRSAPQHMRVSLALLPFQPLAVTIGNGVGIQVPHSHALPSS